VEKNVLNSPFEQLKKRFKGAGILEVGKFGKTDVPLVWVESESAKAIAWALRGDPDLSFDWLENLSVMEVDDVLVVSWFLRSRRTKSQLVLRSTAMPRSATAPVSFPSLSSVWTQAGAQEAEVGELFGIRFDGKDAPRKFLPPGFSGFPLRKDFDMRSVLTRDPGRGGADG
jgi:NADH:ubiquinone oxidoreductase subunit C